MTASLPEADQILENLKYGNDNLVSQNLTTFYYDDASKIFEFKCRVPIVSFMRLEHILDNMVQLDLYILDPDTSDILTTKNFNILKITEKSRQFDYGSSQPLEITIKGIYK